MTELNSGMTEPMCEIKDEFEDYVVDLMYDSSDDGDYFPGIDNPQFIAKLNQLIGNVKFIPDHFFITSFLLAKYKEELGTFAAATFGISARATDWLDQMRTKCNEGNAWEREQLTNQFLNLILGSFAENHCCDPGKKMESPATRTVYASYSPNKIQRGWTRGDLRVEFLENDHLTPQKLFMFAIGVGMPYPILSLFLRKVLKRADFNYRDPEEAMLSIAFQYVDAKERFAFIRAAIQEYNSCTTIQPMAKMDTGSVGSEQLYDFASSSLKLPDGVSGKQLFVHGALTMDMQLFLANYKFLVESLNEESRCVQKERELGTELVEGIRENEPDIDTYDPDTSVYKNVTFKLPNSSVSLKKGTMLVAHPYDNGNPVDDRTAFVAILQEDVKAPTKEGTDLVGTTTVPVTVRLKLEEEQLAYQLPKNATFQWNDYTFTNDVSLKKGTVKGTEISVTGEVPEMLRIRSDTKHPFVVLDKANHPKRFLPVQDVIAYPIYETVVKYDPNASDRTEKEGLIEKQTPFTLSESTDAAAIRIWNKSKFKTVKENNIFVNCDLNTYIREFHVGAYVECSNNAGGVFRYKVVKLDPSAVTKETTTTEITCKARVRLMESKLDDFFDITQNETSSEGKKLANLEWKYDVPKGYPGVRIVNSNSSSEKKSGAERNAMKSVAVRISATTPYLPKGTEFAMEFHAEDDLPLKVDGTYVAELTKGMPEREVCIPLRRHKEQNPEVRERQPVLIKKNASRSYQWNSIDFSNRAEVMAEPVEGEKITAVGIVPVNTVIEKGTLFTHFTDEQKPVLFEAAETVTVFPEYWTVVRWNETSKENDNLEEVTDLVVMTANQDVLLIRAIKKISGSDTDYALMVACSAGEYDALFQKNRTIVLSNSEQSVEVVVIEPANTKFLETNAAFRFYQKTKMARIALTGASIIPILDEGNSTIEKTMSDLKCRLEWNEEASKVVAIVKGVRSSGNSTAKNVNYIYKYLYEEMPLGDADELPPFDPEVKQKLGMILRNKLLAKSRLYALMDSRSNIKQITRSELITLVFLNQALFLQYSNILADTNNIERYFIDEVNEVLDQFGYYELYLGDPYESLLTWILACDQPLNMYRRICQEAA